MSEQVAVVLRLDTWKSIAQYLGRSSRTVQRWHSEYGLPVRHLGGGASSVFAYTDELDGWLRNRDQSVVAPFRIEHPNFSNESPSAEGGGPYLGESGDSFPTPGLNERHASELVILAQRMWESLSESNLSAIARLFREAIDLDPSNATAFAGLSQSLIAESMLGRLHPTAAYQPALAASKRALELDSESLEAKCTFAWLKMLMERDWKSACRVFDESLEKRPKCTQALVGRALLGFAQGAFSDATDLLREALIHRPLNFSAVAFLCWGEYLAGRFERSLTLIAQARESGNTGATLNAIEALAGVMLEGPGLQLHRLEILAADSPQHFALQGVLGYSYGMTGQFQKAREVLDSMTHSGLQGKCDYPYSMALTYIGMNEKEKAIESLEASYRQGSLWSFGFRSDPILEPLRRDSLLDNFLSRLSFPEPELQIVEFQGNH